MTTLWDASLDLARVLTQVWNSTATGGTTTTVVDTAIDEPSNYFGTSTRNGTLWLDLTTDVTKVITGHTTTTLTFSPAQATPTPGAVVAGNVYYAAPADFPRFVLFQSINAALQEIGRMPTVAEVTATIDQQEYDSDDNAIFENEIIKIELANDDSAPYNWTPHYNWKQVELTKRALVFAEGYVPDEANTMRITYLADHATLSTDAGVVNRIVNPNRLKWQAAVHALRWKIAHTKGDEDFFREAYAQAQVNALREAAKYPILYDKIIHSNW
jgi:hypothetical protein